MARQTRPQPDPLPERGQVWRIDGREGTILAVSETHVVVQYPTRVARVQLDALVGAAYIGEEVRG